MIRNTFPQCLILRHERHITKCEKTVGNPPKKLFNIPEKFILLPLTILILMLTTVTAQVKIKEKVEIRPKVKVNNVKGGLNSTATNEYLPCGPWITSSDLYNPWQVVWFHSSYHLDPGQQPFDYQANDYTYHNFIDSLRHYDFIVTEGRDKCHIVEYFKNADGTANPDSTRDAGYELYNIKGSDILGEFGDTDDPNTVKIRTGFQKYSIYFDNPGDITFTINEVGSSEKYYFHTKIVKPDSYVVNSNISSEIPHGEEELVEINVEREQCTEYNEMYNGGGFYGKYNYKIIEGTKYAILIKEYFDEVNFTNEREEGIEFLNLSDESVYLWINGKEPDSTVNVKLKLWTDDTTIEPKEKIVTVTKNENYPLQVKIIPSELEAGDTAEVILKRRISENWFEPVDYAEFPDDQLFDVKIEEGAEYADILLPTQNAKSDSFELVYQGFKLVLNENIDTSGVKLKLRVSTHISDDGSGTTAKSSGDEANKPGSKKKRGNKNTQKNKYSLAFIGVPTGKEIFGIGKAKIGKEIVVQFEPAELLPGDTALVKIYERDVDGNLIEFPAEQKYEIGIMEGCEYGDLLVNDTSDIYFTNVTGPIKYIATDSLTSDSANVTLRVGIIPAEGTTAKNKTNKNINGTAASYCSISGFIVELHGIGKVKVIPPIEIMLGETKYLAVKKKENANEYKIVEIKTDYGTEPKYTDDTNEEWKWVKENTVWGDNPIEKLGTKSGVYWEKKWYDKSDNRNKDLPAGMIRLIGRYWEKDKENSFKVKLKAAKNYTDAKALVIVIKPAKLGDNYSKAKDVFDNVVNIDSLCIYWGGKIGIPPQMIKGQMLQESPTKNFGDDIGIGFTPSYRYEPYTTQFDNNVKAILKKDTNPFIVTETAMGKPGAADVPTKTEHKHLEHGKYFHYFESPLTVWDIIKAKSNIVDINNIYHTYGFQYEGTDSDTLKKGQITTWGIYKNIDNKYVDFLKGEKGDDGKRTGGYEKFVILKYKLNKNANLSRVHQTEANDSARAALIRWLKKKYNKTIAQTRIAASYGLLQTMYTTVLKEHNYPTGNNDKPENLNEVNVSMTYAMKHYKKLFNDYNGFSLDGSNSNWESGYSGNSYFSRPGAGFEEAVKVMYYRWNAGLKNKAKTKAIYHTKVFENSELFLPRRK